MLKRSFQLHSENRELNVYDTHNYTIAMLCCFFLCFLSLDIFLRKGRKKSLSMIVCEHFYGSLLSFSIPWSIFLNHHHDFRWEFIWKYGKYCSRSLHLQCSSHHAVCLHCRWDGRDDSQWNQLKISHFAQRNLITREWKKGEHRRKDANELCARCSSPS